MTSHRTPYLFVILFIIGVGAAWMATNYYDKRENTPENLIQRKVNSAISTDLCDRLSRDIENFKQTPLSYRRVRLSVVEAESRASLRYLLISKGIPKEYPIKFGGDGGKYAGCLSDLRAWLDIPIGGDWKIEEDLEVAEIEADEDYKIAKPIANKNNTKEESRDKIALVVGNSSYQTRPLLNPKNDADDISASLKGLGFNVIDLRDAKLIDLQAGIKRYAEELKSGKVGFFYYSGHGIEYAGRNYLLPIDVRINEDQEIPRQGIDLTVFIEKISRASDLINIIVVDACRSNSIPSSTRSGHQGFSQISATQGTIVAFSTSPGMLAEDGSGRNSPYTKNLLKNLSKPGIRIEEIFKETGRLVDIETGGRQIPWYQSNISKDYSLL